MANSAARAKAKALKAKTTGQWWMSFCDPDNEPGSQFLGVLIIEGKTFYDAITESHRRGLNPGGELQFVELPKAVSKEWLNRLLSKAEALAIPEPKLNATPGRL